MTNLLKLRSYAKVNLSLKVLDKRSDGFHNIDSVFQSISLYDEITLRLVSTSGIKISCHHPAVPLDQSNIVYQAAKALPIQKTGLEISIQKQIPVAAGLGGGSGNAAAVLIGLNQLWELGLTLDQLQHIGATIGADVPFCLVGGLARVGGKGEVVKKPSAVSRKLVEGRFLVVVKPAFSVSTAWAYSQWDKGDRRLVTGDIHYYNDLEQVVIPAYPEIGQIKQKLLDLGATSSLMSGSGPTVFGVFADQETASKAVFVFKGEYEEVYLAQTVPRGVEKLDDFNPSKSQF